jgi:hypothetical protein
VFRIAWRLSTVAITTKVGTDDGKALGKYRRNPMPADMRLRVAMQQQDGRTATTSNEVDGRVLSCDVLTSETIKHGSIEIGVSG